jgi:glycosyltransferase involved in cell wall biosynthesis
MKVLMLAPGGSIHSRRPLRWLLERGHEVTFVDAVDPAPAPSARYRFVPRPRPKVTWLSRHLLPRRWADELVNWVVAVQLRRIWKRTRPDVVHVHWVDSRAYRCVLGGLKPLVLSVWGTDVNQLIDTNSDPHHRRMIARALAAADRVLVDAADMPEKCARVAGRPIRTETLPLGIDTSAFAPGYREQAEAWRRRLEIPSGAVVLLSIRALAARYGHRSVLEAFARAAARCARPAILVFKQYNPLETKEGTACEDDLRQQAERLGITHAVRWMPEVPYDRLPEVYAFSDIVVNYPEMDAFPVTFLEAAACERPVISIRLPAYRRTFAEDFFRMVEPGSTDALADAMVELVAEDPAARAARLARARRCVREEHDQQTTTSRLVGIYQTLVAGPRLSPGGARTAEAGLLSRSR